MFGIFVWLYIMKLRLVCFSVLVLSLLCSQLLATRAEQNTQISKDLKNDILYERSAYRLLNVKKYKIYTKEDFIFGGMDTYIAEFQSKFPNLTELVAPGEEFRFGDLKSGYGYIGISYENRETIKNNSTHEAYNLAPQIFSVTELGIRTTNGDNEKYKQEYYHKPIYKSVCSSFYIIAGGVNQAVTKVAELYITRNSDFYSCLNRLFIDFLGLRNSASQEVIDWIDISEKTKEIQSLKPVTEVSR